MRKSHTPLLLRPIAARSSRVVSAPIFPSASAPTLACSALMSAVEREPSWLTPIQRSRARVVAGPNVPSTARAPASVRSSSREVLSSRPPGWAFASAPPLALVSPARLPQVGQAPGPCWARVRWATAICSALVAWWALPANSCPPNARQVEGENWRPP